MTTATGDAHVESAEADQPQADTEERTYTGAEFRKQQQATSRWQKRAKDLASDLASTETEYQGAIVRIEDRLDTMMRAIGESTLGAGKAEIDQTISRVAESRVKTRTNAQARGELNALLESGEVDWEDERLSEVRALWAAGNSVEALSKARAIVGPSIEQTVKEQVEAEVTKRLKTAGRVDLGTTTVPTGGGAKTSWTDAQKIKNTGDLSDAEYARLVGIK